jgi:cobaltochelatase CobT
MTEQTPLEAFRAVLTGAARAIAHEPEVELAYTADAPVQAGKNLKVPMPGRALPAAQVAEARGFADGFALRLRHHDVGTHGRNAPAPVIARAVFDAVETVRIEALGSRGMAGMRDNLSHALDMRMRSDPISRAKAKCRSPLRLPCCCASG